MWKYISLASLLVLSSCGGGDADVQVNRGVAVPNDTSSSTYVGVGPGTGPSGGGAGSAGGASIALEEQTFDLIVQDGRGTLDFTIRSGSRAMIRFDGIAGKDMTASLIPLSGEVGGYRFSQIFFPDGRSEGPFEKTVAYTLSATGKHGLRIMPDTSAGVAGGGRMRVEITLR